MTCDLFIFAGEASGDLHGEKLLKALYEKEPNLQVAAVAGPLMRAFKIDTVMEMEKFQVMGFVDVFLALPRLIKLFKAVKQAILEKKPKIVVTIDYPGFNLRLARALRKAGFTGKIIQYISPSVWAHGKGRIAFMAKHFDHLLSILPFEKQHFAKTALPVTYVGNPLTEEIAARKPIPGLIALFPGSRKKEIERNFPLYLDVARRLKEKHGDLTFAVSLASERYRKLLEDLMRQKGVAFPLCADTKELFSTASLAIAKSGTITLQLALHEIPTVVTYRISPLDLFIAKYLLRIKLPYYALPSIILGKEVFPELIGPAFTEKALFARISKLIQEKAAADSCRSSCLEVKKLLGGKIAAQEAANLILKTLHLAVAEDKFSACRCNS